MADILDDEKYSYEEFDKKLDNTNSQYFNSLTKEIKDSGDLYVTQITRKQTQEQLKRTRHRADAPLDFVRHQLRKDVKQTNRVIQPFLRGPIGLINAFFDAGAVKTAIGKSVDRENVAMIFIEPAAEIQESLRVFQFTRSLVAQTQADGIIIFRANAFADGKGVISEGLKSFGPRFSTVDIRAIGEMKSVLEFHFVP